MQILVVRLSSLGDVVHAIPVMAALRRRFPDARIDWLIDDRYRELVELVSGVDHPVAVPRRPGVSWLTGIVPGLRATRYDVAVDLQGLVKSAVLARASGARRVIGFPPAQLREAPAGWFYTEQPAMGNHPHVIAKNLALVESLGVPPKPWEFPLRDVATDVVKRTLGTNGEGSKHEFALLNPGAAWKSKRWAPTAFGALAQRLHEQHDLVSVVAWGPGEKEMAGVVVDASGGRAVLAPPMSLADLVTLARAAAVMVSGDTGPLHVAAAVGTPLVGVYGPSSPRRNGPWAVSDLVVSRFDDCRCRRGPSSEGVVVRRCLQSIPCISTIPVDEVAGAVARRLAVPPIP